MSWHWLMAALSTLAFGAVAAAQPIVVASKSFTEGVIVGEIVTQRLQAEGLAASHRRELGGTRILFTALERGDIDVYGEYTGTLSQEILAAEGVSSLDEIRRALAARGIGMTAPFGFNNTYALGMREERAQALGIRTLSDLARHPALRFGFTNEFLNRGDGWPGLQERYALPQRDVRGLDHDLAYRALQRGDLDAMDLYSTDAEIAYYGLRVLDDDRQYFPRYDAVVLYRLDLATRAPAATTALASLAGSISEPSMVAMNAAVKLDRRPDAAVASAFLTKRFADVVASVPTTAAPTWRSRLAQRTREHLFLVVLSMVAAILVAIPLGIVSAYRPRLGHLVLGTVSVIQTIPALALLVLMIPVLGIYAPPALAALFLYSLLPIVRNTHTGLTTIAPSLRESAAALGLRPWSRLRRVELPLAAPHILAGIKTAVVINIGFATLGALIGAGGYGQPILTGIRLDDTGLILEGALPAAVLALLAQGLFDLAERWLVPAGLRQSTR